MRCFHAIMSIKPEFDPQLNEYIFSFTGGEIVSVISLTECKQKQSVKGIRSTGVRNALKVNHAHLT